METTVNENMENKEVAPKQTEEQTYRCNDCGNVIYKHEVFCSKCGKLLDRYDFED
ncbi:MAG: zinc-ribbon domain-containing protein [Bacteroidaceae bacterium]|nr:zinc-ribbon domain-containing protein [Bacteroidaceae bacterium]